MNRTEYLESLTEQISNKHAKELVRAEICAHIEDQKEAYLLEGKEEDEAELLAVREMGDPVDAGSKLNKIHRPKTDIWMLGAMAALTVIGIIMQTIICSGFDNLRISNDYGVRTILFNLIGLCVMLSVYFADYRILGKHIWKIYGIYLAGSIFFLRMPPYTPYSNYLILGQTVCFLFVPLFAAICYRFRDEKTKGILKALGILFLHMFLLLLAGYYRSAAMILTFMACLITLTAAAFKGIFGGRKKMQAGVLLAFIIGIPALFLGDILLLGGRFLSLAEYQIRRIQVMFSPFAYEGGASYQTLLIRSQLADASLLGGGDIGQIGEIAGAWCDYVLICLTSYFGLLIGIAVVAAVCAFLVRSLHISLTQSNRLGFLLGISCSSILILKTVIYVAMNFGVGPIVGIDMPFLTYGLNCTVINFLYIGLILSVYRNTNLLPELKNMPPRYRLKFEKVKEH